MKPVLPEPDLIRHQRPMCDSVGQVCGYTNCRIGRCLPGKNWPEQKFHTAETVQSLIDQAYEAGMRDAVPEGWRAVPVDPTAEMNQAAVNKGCGRMAAVMTYKAMLSASPEPKK